jgi:hypothetical protein
LCFVKEFPETFGKPTPETFVSNLPLLGLIFKMFRQNHPASFFFY